MELAFPRSADLQRRFAALLTGVFAHRCAPDAPDSATGSNEVFCRVLHSASVRLIARRGGTGVTWHGKLPIQIIGKDLSRAY